MKSFQQAKHQMWYLLKVVSTRNWSEDVLLHLLFSTTCIFYVLEDNWENVEFLFYFFMCILWMYALDIVYIDILTKEPSSFKKT